MPNYIFEMWCLIGLFIIRLDGAPNVAMWCNIISAAMNIVLDWLFIFPLGMGVKGAAIATTLSVMTGGMIAMAYLLFYARTLRLAKVKWSAKSLSLSLRNVGYHCRIGSSTLLGEMTLAVLIFTGNLVFMHYLGDDGVAAFGVACYYTPLFFNIGNAVAQSAQPIISYNYGAGRWEQIVKARRMLLGTAMTCGLLVTLLFVSFPYQLVALFFDPSVAAGRLAIDGLPYYAAGVTFFILNVAAIGYFQSVERIREATIFALLRGLIILVPSFVLMPRMAGIHGIWLAMAATETITTAAIAATSLASRLHRRYKVRASVNG